MNLKVITFNFRMQTSRDGVNAFVNRLPFILDFIASERPDIIGGQELLPDMRAALAAGLPDYYIVGQGRGADNFDEASSVFFRKERFALSDCDTFWLSRTPRVAGSRYAAEGQSGCPRICTCVKLIELKSGRPLRVYNTHLDHVGSIPRLLGIRQILRKMRSDYKREPLPFMLTGDMNAEPTSPEIRAVLSSPSGSFPRITDLTASIPVTCHDFGRGAEKIDYIFSPENTVLHSVRAAAEKCGELWLSDHYPIIAEITIDSARRNS